MAAMEGEGIPEDDSSARFEDLTVDDDLPIIERVVRYVKSAIALQRLVHVKMLAETAELVGYVWIGIMGTGDDVYIVTHGLLFTQQTSCNSKSRDSVCGITSPGSRISDSSTCGCSVTPNCNYLHDKSSIAQGASLCREP